MRLVRLKLRGSCPLWMLPPISLHKKQLVSPLLNIDKLTNRQKKIINDSIDRKDILLLDADSIPILGNLDDIGITISNKVSTEDVTSADDEFIPEIISVTEDDDCEEECEAEPAITEEIIEEVKVLLDRHHNTIKKVLRGLEDNDYNRLFLQACIDVESNDKARQTVLSAIQQKISEL